MTIPAICNHCKSRVDLDRRDDPCPVCGYEGPKTWLRSSDGKEQLGEKTLTVTLTSLKTAKEMWVQYWDDPEDGPEYLTRILDALFGLDTEEEKEEKGEEEKLELGVYRSDWGILFLTLEDDTYKLYNQNDCRHTFWVGEVERLQNFLYKIHAIHVVL